MRVRYPYYSAVRVLFGFSVSVLLTLDVNGKTITFMENCSSVNIHHYRLAKTIYKETDLADRNCKTPHISGCGPLSQQGVLQVPSRTVWLAIPPEVIPYGNRSELLHASPCETTLVENDVSVKIKMPAGKLIKKIQNISENSSFNYMTPDLIWDGADNNDDHVSNGVHPNTINAVTARIPRVNSPVN